MAVATVFTSTSVILATGLFSNAILATGVAPLGAAVMALVGVTVIAHLPHGTYIHVTRDAMMMSMKDRMEVVMFESIVGLMMTIVAAVLFGFIL